MDGNCYSITNSNSNLLHGQRLSDLLQNEERQYMAEMSSRKETVLERQARMRERAKSLRDKRETERLNLVESKLDQRWRYTHVLLYIK